MKFRQYLQLFSILLGIILFTPTAQSLHWEQRIDDFHLDQVFSEYPKTRTEAFHILKERQEGKDKNNANALFKAALAHLFLKDKPGFHKDARKALKGLKEKFNEAYMCHMEVSAYYNKTLFILRNKEFTDKADLQLILKAALHELDVYHIGKKSLSPKVNSILAKETDINKICDKVSSLFEEYWDTERRKIATMNCKIGILEYFLGFHRDSLTSVKKNWNGIPSKFIDEPKALFAAAKIMQQKGKDKGIEKIKLAHNS